MKTPDRRALRRIELKNLLSFGPDSPALELENLNILIGPNGSGKSNLIEAISLLRATPMSADAPKPRLRDIVTRSGDWVFKGNRSTGAALLADIQAVGFPGTQFEHLISFGSTGTNFRLGEERIKFNEEEIYHSGPFARDCVWIKPWDGDRRKLDRSTLNQSQSILSQIPDEGHPELEALAYVYQDMRIYRDWTFGRSTVFRNPQPIEATNNHLEEDFSNLGLTLSRLRNTPKVKKALNEFLRDLYDGLTDFEISIRDGYVEIYFHEGDYAIPARRLSDGTIRYLCLLAILLDPVPPGLVCIEEPELGFHPDILPKLADLLVYASERTQLIVTTHSDILVDAMTDRPDAVVLCEKHEGQTHMRRLTKNELAPWVQKYRLGELWSRGYIGANRW